jgi:hypothetical protein
LAEQIEAADMCIFLFFAFYVFIKQKLCVCFAFLLNTHMNTEFLAEQIEAADNNM